MSDKTALLNTLLGLSMIVEARDPYTGGHLWRVSQFSRLLAQEAGLSRRDIALCEIGGFLHDLGKIGVPDAILNKPDSLTGDEYAVIQTHPAVGGRLLTNHPLAALAFDAVVGHHERPDGRGYPQGLAGAVIPEVARVVGIADAFDAMTSTRPYRKGMRVEKALEIIRNESGSQFDATLAGHFLAVSHSAELVHVIGHSEPGLPLLFCPACHAPVAVRRAQHADDHLYCRACGGESRLTQDVDGMELEMTGQRGDAAALAPDSDPDLIGTMVEDIAPRVF
ncbi:MAG: HD-GYP domain-containing protein [Gallionella sp.]|nr:HD-GYP domain-containing protein [Gallionella sp.]OIO82197.1 MAG: phosphohydrolase [Gallionellaceae bacterium CG1_02_56_997]PIR09973.1 MAG: phosphohydrolase [Gallionellaceae bacterium CG11_big_fil_rev_8_21_14_0_20_60_62]